MELPKELLARFPKKTEEKEPNLRKETRKEWLKKWRNAKLNVQRIPREILLEKEGKNLEKIAICMACGIRGHYSYIHEKNASLYEVVGGRVGCIEEFVANSTTQQFQGRFITFKKKYLGKKWKEPNGRR